MSYPDLDLFGDPIVSQDRGRGRPLLRYDKEKALLISGLAALGMPQRKIISRVGMSEPTMRRLYSRELGASPETAKRRALRSSRKENGNG